MVQRRCFERLVVYFFFLFCSSPECFLKYIVSHMVFRGITLVLRMIWIIFSICFKFAIPKEYFCDICCFDFSLLLLKMTFKCLINVNQQNKKETLRKRNISWYKASTDKDIPKQVLWKNLFSNLVVLFLGLKNLKCNCEWVHWVKMEALSLLFLWKMNCFVGICFTFQLQV